MFSIITPFLIECLPHSYLIAFFLITYCFRPLNSMLSGSKLNAFGL